MGAVFIATQLRVDKMVKMVDEVTAVVELPEDNITEVQTVATDKGQAEARARERTSQDTPLDHGRELSPGRGGRPHTSSDNWFGGGGGGVMVDGEGPPRPSEYQGSGYGGGGSGYSSHLSSESGLPGVILIEVFEAE